MQAYSGALASERPVGGLGGEVLKESWLAKERHHRRQWMTVFKIRFAEIYIA